MSKDRQQVPTAHRDCLFEVGGAESVAPRQGGAHRLDRRIERAGPDVESLIERREEPRSLEPAQQHPKGRLLA